MNNYKQVYFRIKTPSYYNKGGVGFENTETKDNFHNTVRDIFLNQGWELNSRGRIIKDKQELHLHPQELTGVVLEENIKPIEQLLSNNNIFSFVRTDIYEDVFDISDDEYIKILESKHNDVEKNILTIFKTKRKNLFITDTWTALNNVLNKYRMKRLTYYGGGLSSSDNDILWITELFENMVSENKIETAKTRSSIGYRSIVTSN